MHGIPQFTVERMRCHHLPLGEISLPGGVLRLTLGLGSGLARRSGDIPGRLWAIGDRGPNLKVRLAVERYGLGHLACLQNIPGVKIMPRPDLGPTIVELSIIGDAISAVRTIELRTADGRRFSGLPIPGGNAAAMEPVHGLDGEPLGVDEKGADTEALVALSDGTFWVAEEYGPSLLKVFSNGVVLQRWMPRGSPLTTETAGYPVASILPAIATRRRLNRGFEALAVSPNERWLYVAFQSALTGARGDARREGRHARIWKIDAASGAVVGEHLYPFDEPRSFRRDRQAGSVSAGDLKICEAVCAREDVLLIMERISKTAKIYQIELCAPPISRSFLNLATRPSLEELSEDALLAAGIRPLDKTLIFSTDEAPDIDADLEGMAILSDRELILVTDNDFGVEGVATGFFRVTFDDARFG